MTLAEDIALQAEEEAEYARSRAAAYAQDASNASPPVRHLRQQLFAPQTPPRSHERSPDVSSPPYGYDPLMESSMLSTSRAGSTLAKRCGLPSPPSQSRIELPQPEDAPGPLTYDRHDVKGFYSSNPAERMDNPPVLLPSSMFSSGTPRFTPVAKPAHFDVRGAEMM